MQGQDQWGDGGALFERFTGEGVALFKVAQTQGAGQCGVVGVAQFVQLIGSRLACAVCKRVGLGEQCVLLIVLFINHCYATQRHGDGQGGDNTQ